MGGKRGKRLLNALFVADIRQNIVENPHHGAVGRGNMQSRLRHEREKAERFEGDGFSARVRTRDNQRIEFSAEVHRNRNNRIGGNQRMARPAQPDFARFRDFGRDAVHFKGKLAFSEDKSEHGKISVILRKLRAAARDVGGKLKENPFDFIRLQPLQKPQLVVRFDDGERLDENRRAGRGGIVNEALDLVPIFLLDRNDIAAVAHRDDLLLKIFGICAAGDIFLQRIADFAVLRAHPAPDFIELVARGIGYRVLAHKAARDLLLQKFVGGKPLKVFVERRGFRMVGIAVIAHGARGGKRSGDGEDFFYREDRALIRAVDGSCDVGDAVKRRHSLDRLHRARGIRLRKHAAHRENGARGTERRRHFSRALGRADGGEHLAYFIKFERFYRSVEAFSLFHAKIQSSSDTISHSGSGGFSFGFRLSGSYRKRRQT